MARTLKEKGYRDVRILEAGFNALLAIGYPMERKQAKAA